MQIRRKLLAVAKSLGNRDRIWYTALQLLLPARVDWPCEWHLTTFVDIHYVIRDRSCCKRREYFGCHWLCHWQAAVFTRYVIIVTWPYFNMPQKIENKYWWPSTFADCITRSRWIKAFKFHTACISWVLKLVTGQTSVAVCSYQG
jgi:hypothetical protein